jgi:hypothetical protein
MLVIAMGWCIQRVAENIIGITTLIGCDYRVWNMGHLTSAIPCLPPFPAVIHNLKIIVKKKTLQLYFLCITVHNSHLL